MVRIEPEINCPAHLPAFEVPQAPWTAASHGKKRPEPLPPRMQRNELHALAMFPEFLDMAQVAGLIAKGEQVNFVPPAEVLEFVE